MSDQKIGADGTFRPPLTEAQRRRMNRPTDPEEELRRRRFEARTEAIRRPFLTDRQRRSLYWLGYYPPLPDRPAPAPEPWEQSSMFGEEPTP